MICLFAAAIPAGCAPGPEAAGDLRLPALASLERPVEGPDPRWRTWQPVRGRMTDSTARRHLPPEAEPRGILTDEFESASDHEVPGWEIAGGVMLRPVSLEGRNGIELTAPATVPEICGIERRIEASAVRGRDVRIELALSVRSARRAAALKGVRIAVIGRDAAGRSQNLDLPLTADISPGWETAAWWIRVAPEVESLALRVLTARPGAIITLDRVAVLAWPDAPAPLGIQAEQSPAATGSAATRPAPVVNLIPDGDFETGHRSFLACGLRRWPGGEEYAVPLRWSLDGEAAVGRTALRFELDRQTARVGFGPLRLDAVPGAERLHLAFQARADRPCRGTATLRTPDRVLGRGTFEVGPGWQQFTHAFETGGSGREAEAAELLIDMSEEAPQAEDSPTTCWLDAVSLTDAPPTERPVRPAGPRVGLIMPEVRPTDLCSLLAEDAEATFGLRVVAPAEASPGRALRLAVDMLDAFDRVVWTKTVDVVTGSDGLFVDEIRLRMPRGYFRLLATLWSGEPGQSRMLSQACGAVGVIAANDPVPSRNRFGLIVEGPLISMRTTHLGAGWVRADLVPARLQVVPGKWDFGLWAGPGGLLAMCEQAQVEVVAALTLPPGDRERRGLVQQWLGSNTIEPIGLVVAEPVQAAAESAAFLGWVAELLAARSPSTRLVRDISGFEGLPVLTAMESTRGAGLAAGVAFASDPLPESAEPVLEAIGARAAGAEIWDLAVPVELEDAARPLWPGPETLRPVGGGSMLQLLAAPSDPVLSASRMVRAMVIRVLAGASMCCCNAALLAPPRSVFEHNRRRLHEADLSPRPATVAFDVMTSLLNGARCLRWVEQRGGSRVVCFARPDGSGVAVCWRPFGSQPTTLSFAGLPAGTRLLDCTGNPEPTVTAEERLIVEVNEQVRYLVSGPGDAEAMARAMDSILLLYEPLPTQPAR